MRFRTLKVAAFVLLTVALSAFAHGGAHHVEEPEFRWATEPWSVVSVLLVGGLYAVGLSRLWSTSAVGHGVSRTAAACFAAGWISLVVALVSPLHPMGEKSFAAHMLQH